jgi:hypothetical protein
MYCIAVALCGHNAGKRAPMATHNRARHGELGDRIPLPSPVSSGKPALCYGVAASAQSHCRVFTRQDFVQADAESSASAMAGKREAGTRELMTRVRTRAPIPNTLVPAAPSCVEVG